MQVAFWSCLCFVADEFVQGGIAEYTLVEFRGLESIVRLFLLSKQPPETKEVFRRFFAVGAGQQTTGDFLPPAGRLPAVTLFRLRRRNHSRGTRRAVHRRPPLAAV